MVRSLQQLLTVLLVDFCFFCQGGQQKILNRDGIWSGIDKAIGK
jgi:hypothetical protein